MGQAQINVRTRACSRTSIARTRQAALTHNVRGKELRPVKDHKCMEYISTDCVHACNSNIFKNRIDMYLARRVTLRVVRVDS